VNSETNTRDALSAPAADVAQKRINKTINTAAPIKAHRTRLSFAGFATSASAIRVL
jgi:hypothetical protein